MALDRETSGDLILSDMGQGVPFRAGAFDGAVSVSALQWLFNADKKEHKPIKRIYNFFCSLYASLVIFYVDSLYSTVVKYIYYLLIFMLHLNVNYICLFLLVKISQSSVPVLPRE